MDVNQLATTTLTTALPALCTTTIWPGVGVVTWGPGGEQVPVVEPIIYQAPCSADRLRPPRDMSITVAADSSLTQHDSEDSNVKFSDFRDPFYASIFPICYALAATTVTAYMLVIMLFVTPRSFLDGGIVYLGRRGGFTHSSGTGISIGGRPWLQKVAALTVAISLTVASIDTFSVAQNQYTWGIQNAKELQEEIMGSTELKVIRLVSDTFLWLAQAQTLIRLFPRQREKIIIKWVAFALIILDLIFSALNSFQYSENGINSTVRPKNFVHPVPALSYLFQLALGVLYAAWVLYYAIMKKRYAFYHPFMKNIFLVAIISILSIVIPIVFFILDISKPDFTGWGDYVRWVGAAAASVVVWEWVERIEALEREEKKDGILGREVFDGDDMLEVDASEFPWLRNRKNRKGGVSGAGGAGERQQPSASMANGWVNMSAIANRYRGASNDAPETAAAVSTQRSMGTILRPPIWPTRPAPIATPVSRTDTASAASTVYAVRYQPSSEATTRTPDPLPQQSAVDLSGPNSDPPTQPSNDDGSPWTQTSLSPQNGHAVAPVNARSADLEANNATQSQDGWRSLTFANPLFRQSNEEATNEAPPNRQSPTPEPRATGRWDLRARLEDFAVHQADKVRERMRTAPNTETLPVTVIPAPPRRGAALQQVLEEEELITADHSLLRDEGANSNSSSSRDASGEITQLDASRSTFSNSQQGEAAIPPNNPPLWRGVQSRMIYQDGYYSDEDVGSISETSSIDHRRQDSDSSRRSRVP
ncbi:PalH/RIM21-domain-containing protein [Dactylonectria macrodidyma]|uniref:PalH/RIM21-domain-containing protein n=1 Tax=Dactylonectria macrodidyma TaxID=307937 RepID=A0A9P9ET77_9HYPO|nr:PalH/RIM21-domain-containing protein [Dactylonectria macrodidyma]